MGKGQKGMTFNEDLIRRLSEAMKKDPRAPKNSKVGSYARIILTEYVEFIEEMNKYGAFMEYRGGHEREVYIRDNKLGKTVVVDIIPETKQLRCQLHENIDCIHVGFCYAVKEVYDVLIKNGFRPPRKLNTS